jgi:hypothetical protein
VIRHLAILCLVLRAVPATAQTVTLLPSDPKSWDAAVTVGWLGGNKGGLAEEWNDWYDTVATSVEAGRYWTPHFKTEARLTLTSSGSVYSVEQTTAPGARMPVFLSREHHFGLTALDLSTTYQFFDNAWIHPLVGAGAQLGSERQRTETFPPVAAEPATRRFTARPFVTAGAKFYTGEHAFIRTDLSAAFDHSGADRVWWRIGAGIDF